MNIKARFAVTQESAAKAVSLNGPYSQIQKNGSVVSPKSGTVMLPALCFLLKIALAAQGLLCFHMNYDSLLKSSNHGYSQYFKNSAQNFSQSSMHVYFRKYT